MKHRVSEELLRREIHTIRELLDAEYIQLDCDFENLVITTEIEARDGERFRIEFECSNYDQAPPYVETIDPETDERDTARAIFDDRNASAHGSGENPLLWNGGPAVCHAFNRKMYLDVNQVHDAWNPSSISNWHSLASPHDTLAEIHELIYRRLRSDAYNGRFSDTQ